jgi:transmembrane sensor
MNIMNHNQDYIRQLITEKLIGTISDDDRVYLEEMILRDSEARLLWEEMRDKWTALEGDSKLEQLNLDTRLEEVKDNIHNRNKPFSFTQWQLANVAALLILFIGMWTVLKSKNNAVISNGAVMTEKPSKKIELVLGSGKTLNISGQPQTINVDDIELKAAAGTLQYSGTSRASEQYNTLNIPEEADYKLILSDGSKVWLNSSSSLKFPFAFSGKTRDVYLTGEAYFEVAKNSKQPFLVHTSKTNIQVLGTSFNVNTYEDGLIKTSLVEGRVKTFSLDGDSTLLRPGFEAYYDDLKKEFQVKPFDKEYVLSWIEGSYLFNKVPLENLTGTLERWFGVEVVSINKKVIGKTLVSGIIEKGKLKEFLENLNASTGIKYTLKNNILDFTAN